MSMPITICGGTPDDAPVTIANFICAAIMNGLVKEIVWVVPDLTWETKRDRKQVVRHLENIVEEYPGPKSALQVDDCQISTVVLGKVLRVCSLDSLPVTEERVLLDIDVDFLIIPRVSYNKFDQHLAVPWCWPSELLERLSVRNLSADVVTIAYSVNGGYTPLKWKYLGDELALRLRGAHEGKRQILGMDLMREAVMAATKGNSAAAELKYRQAVDLLPGLAAPSYHLAHLSVEKGRVSDGRKIYRRALALDPSYRTIFSGVGLQHYWDGQFGQAEREYLKTLELDPDNAEAHFGLGLLAKRRRHWEQSEALLKKAVELDANFLDGYRALGDVLARRGCAEEAIVAYTRALRLALDGHKPRHATIITLPEDDRHLKDPWHFQTYAQLAEVYAVQGALTEAINLYRMSIAGGNDALYVKLQLASLYLRKAQWKNAVGELKNAVQALLKALWNTQGRLYRRVQRAL